MRRRQRTFGIALALTVLALGALAAPAGASFHEMKIREISAGTGTADSSYVEIQAYSAGERFLSGGAELAICNDVCSGGPAVFTGFTDVANGADQMTVVFGDSGLPSASKDFTRDLNLQNVAAGGAACYVSEPGFADCVSWGNFQADGTLMADFGTVAGSPAPALTVGTALRRSITAFCPTQLEPADDTNNSAADFATTAPDPRPNSVTPTETACPSSSTPVVSTTHKKKCKRRKKPAAPTGPAYSAKKHKCKKKKRR